MRSLLPLHHHGPVRRLHHFTGHHHSMSGTQVKVNLVSDVFCWHSFTLSSDRVTQPLSVRAPPPHHERFTRGCRQWRFVSLKLHGDKTWIDWLPSVPPRLRSELQRQEITKGQKQSVNRKQSSAVISSCHHLNHPITSTFKHVAPPPPPPRVPVLSSSSFSLLRHKVEADDRWDEQTSNWTHDPPPPLKPGSLIWF